MNLGVIGLGSMGYGMAASLLRAGHRVWGGDVNREAVARLQTEGGSRQDLAEAAAELDALVIVVLNADQTEEVLFGQNSMASRLRKGCVVICCVTVAPDFARAMEKRCASQGLLYLDAPISGGSVKAAQGKLSIMASGSAEAFAAARPVLDATAEAVFELGDAAGAGSAMKAVNQMLAGVHIAAMAEAITFGISQGVAPETFLEVIPLRGTSWMLENRARRRRRLHAAFSHQHLAQDLGSCWTAHARSAFRALYRNGAAAVRGGRDMGLGRKTTPPWQGLRQAGRPDPAAKREVFRTIRMFSACHWLNGGTRALSVG